MSSSLTLYTPDNRASLAHPELIELLESIELTGDPLGPFQFLAGKRFFNHITFLGCAPNIPMRPDQGQNHIRIFIPQLTSPALFAGTRVPAPICPNCKQAIKDWKTRIEGTESDALSCLHCLTSTPLDRLNFRKRACFSQNIIRIEPVFESEAIPASGLLDTLHRAFSVDFKYAYIGS